MDRAEPLRCEDARFLVSRGLDADLARDEVRRLYVHLAACEACRAYAAELADVESSLHALGQTSEAAASEMFVQRVAAAVGAEPRRRAERRRAIARGWLRSPAFAGLAGAVAAAAVVILWPGGQRGEAPIAPSARFVMHPVEFVSAQDKVDWNHDHTIAPGHTLKTVIDRSDGGAHQLRFRSEGPVDVSIVHDDPSTADPQDATHRFTLHGVRYAVLHAPRAQDVVVIRNDGAHPVHVSVRAPQPGAVRITTERHRPI